VPVVSSAVSALGVPLNDEDPHLVHLSADVEDGGLHPRSVLQWVSQQLS